jgi:hypothetical protein
VKNIAVEVGIQGPAFGDKFKVKHPSNVVKHDEHALGCAAALDLGILGSSIVTTVV